MYVFFLFLGSSGSLDDPAAPPKPSRQPSVDHNKTELPVSTYIVAQNAEVLAHLLKENEQRGVNPSVYTTPATGFNTVTVDFLNDIDDDKTISAGNSILSMDSVGLIPMDGSGVSGQPSTTNKTLPRNFTSGAASLTLPNSDKRRCSDGSLSTCAAATGGGINNEVPLAVWYNQLHDCSFALVLFLFFVIYWYPLQFLTLFLYVVNNPANYLFSSLWYNMPITINKNILISWEGFYTL